MTTRIAGTGSYVPEQIVINDDLAKIVETNDEWTRNQVGVGTRRIATNEGTSYVAVEASTNVLENADVKPDEIDLILLATSSPDYCFPNGACGAQDRVGAIDTTYFDISAVCTGFVYTLNTAHAFINSGIYKAALVADASVLSKLIDWTDRGTCVLFGDGAGVAAVKADETGILGVNIHSDGIKGGVLTCGSRTNGNFLLDKKSELGYMTVDGQEVFKLTVKRVPQRVAEVLEDTGMKAEDIRHFVIHQTNYRVIESIVGCLKISVDRFPVSMEHYGSISGASISILLDELNRKGVLSAGDKVVLSGSGAGLTWGAALLEW